VYTPQQSLLYGTAGGGAEFVFLIACGFLGDRYGHCIAILSVGLMTTILGMVLIVALLLDNNKRRLAGYYLTQGVLVVDEREGRG
jgi:ACS family allantoate permease-like MFS transporter